MQTDSGTSQDVFDNVFARDEQPAEQTADKTAPHYESQPRDDLGKWTSEQPAPKPEATQVLPAPDQQQAAQPAPVETQDTTRDPATGRMIPLPELLNERQKRQEAERRFSDMEARLRAYEQQQAQFAAQYQQNYQQQQQQPPALDPYADPQAFVQQMQDTFQRQMRDQIANMSEAHAVRSFGAEIVQKARDWAIQNGAAQHFYMNARDPYGELIEAYKKAETINRIGPDPDAYEKRIREEERARVLAELKSGGANGQPKPVFPGSLASATATGAQGAVLSPQSAIDAVFARPGG